MLLLQVLLLGCVALHLSESSPVQTLYEPPFLSSDHHGNDISDADDTFAADFGQSTSEPDDLGIGFQTRGFGKKEAWAPYAHALATRGFGNKRGMGNKRGFGNKRSTEDERFAAVQELVERLRHQAEREGLADLMRYGSQVEGGDAADVTDAKRGFGNKRASVRHRGEDVVFWWPRPQQA
ncbi:uncharacterized protein LOC144864814 [Branchiostoma floridae x Branchiostoma japonicum]